MTAEERESEDRAIVTAAAKAFGAPCVYIAVGVVPADAANDAAQTIIVAVGGTLRQWPTFIRRRAKMVAAVRELAPRADIEVRWGGAP